MTRVPLLEEKYISMSTTTPQGEALSSLKIILMIHCKCTCYTSLIQRRFRTFAIGRVIEICLSFNFLSMIGEIVMV